MAVRRRVGKSRIDIFISHSASDKKLASALVKLLVAAFKLRDVQIRCTSVDGYKLPAGISVENRLHTEVHHSKIFVALITPHSLKSMYFLMELGARWGANQLLCPLFAVGANSKDLNDWLRNYHGVNVESSPDMLQLLQNLGSVLKRKPENPSAYLNHFKQCAAISRATKIRYLQHHGQPDESVQRKLEVDMKSEDGTTTMGDAYATFWSLARKYFSKFRPKSDRDFPRELDALIGAAGAPPWTVGADLLSWPSLNKDRLNEDQRRLWKFVTNIYPARQGDPSKDVIAYSSIKPKADAKAFHEARRLLGKHWDKWADQVGFEFIRKRYSTRRQTVLVLAWLELALTQWTKSAGGGKQPLFRLAEEFAKS